MKAKSVITGISFAIAAGTAAYAVANASQKEKRTLKTKAGKALHAMGDVMDTISDMIER